MYNRSLDFSTGLHTTTFTANDNNTYTTTVYCSYPDQVCVYDLSSTSYLPKVTILLENQLTKPAFFNTPCDDQHVRLTGLTQLGPPLGMKYDGIARLSMQSGSSNCVDGAVVVSANEHNKTLSIIIGAETNYNQKSGNPTHDFSFKGEDPRFSIKEVTVTASTRTEASLRSAHIADYFSLMSQFTFSLPDAANSSGLETYFLIQRYNSSGPGDPYLESILVSLGRHLLISSQRANSLPSNLQGKWSETITAPWSTDYHSNINFQMNQWGAEQIGLGS